MINNNSWQPTALVCAGGDWVGDGDILILSGDDILELLAGEFTRHNGGGQVLRSFLPKPWRGDYA